MAALGDSLTALDVYDKEFPTADGKQLKLSSFAGKPIVVFFFPKAATPGCTKEACKFRDEYEVFKQAGAAVIGVSGDKCADNASFASAQRLTYPLLTDEGAALRKALGVKRDLFGLLPGRQSFVFDKEGKNVMVFRSQMNAEQHVAEALKVVKSLT
ncbi:hypothetical protein WJX81_003905 [Elliptochloris bilobata]|uniref:thioredoxin-dependent peroxiredoxin n=1 Tax=Elliptochloris bilobata TaxID=381761 RepID=A0AAW1S3K8_9CHLO